MSAAVMYNDRLTVLEMAARVDYTLKGFSDMLDKGACKTVTERRNLRRKIRYLESLPHAFSIEDRENPDEMIRKWLRKCNKYMVTGRFKSTPSDLDILAVIERKRQQARAEKTKLTVSERCSNIGQGKRQNDDNELSGAVKRMKLA